MSIIDNAYQAALGRLDLDGPNGERLVIESRARHFGLNFIQAVRFDNWSDWLPVTPMHAVLGAPSKPGIVSLGKPTLPPGHADTGGGHVVEEVCYFQSDDLALVALPASEDPFVYVKYLPVEDASEREALLLALNRRLVLDQRRASYWS
jgi:hypothetical protein